MTTQMETAKALIRNLFQAMDAHDIDAASNLVAENLVDHAAIPAAQGRAGFRTIAKKLFKAFPDMKQRMDDLIADGDKVVVRMTVSGTHTGPLEFVNRPLAATGKSFTTTHIHIFRVADGRVVEHWTERDELGMLKQLGALPGTSS